MTCRTFVMLWLKNLRLQEMNIMLRRKLVDFLQTFSDTIKSASWQMYEVKVFKKLLSIFHHVHEGSVQYIIKMEQNSQFHSTVPTISLIAHPFLPIFCNYLNTLPFIFSLIFLPKVSFTLENMSYILSLNSETAANKWPLHKFSCYFVVFLSTFHNHLACIFP